MGTHFKIFAALHEDISAPYVWLSERPDMPRPLVTLLTCGNRKKVVCQALKIEDNFRDRYKASNRTLELPNDVPVAVMSEWYRDCLGIRTGETVEIQVKPICQCIACFSQLRSAFSHPDHNVRLAANLAIVSVALGIIGLMLGIISLVK